MPVTKTITAILPIIIIFISITQTNRLHQGKKLITNLISTFYDSTNLSLAQTLKHPIMTSAAFSSISPGFPCPFSTSCLSAYPCEILFAIFFIEFFLFLSKISISGTKKGLSGLCLLVLFSAPFTKIQYFGLLSFHFISFHLLCLKK